MLQATNVNTTGLKAIQKFLDEHHKNGHGFSEEQLHAWAHEAEFQLGEGNPACIEIKARDSVTGVAIEFAIPDVGLEFSEVWEAWLDGEHERAERFFVPTGGTADVAAMGANALGVNLNESVNVKRV